MSETNTYSITAIRLDGKTPYERCWSFCPTLDGAKKIIKSIGHTFHEEPYDHIVIEEMPLSASGKKGNAVNWFRWNGSDWGESEKPVELK